MSCERELFLKLQDVRIILDKDMANIFKNIEMCN